MLPDRVSNPGPLTYESGALPIALRGPAVMTGRRKQKSNCKNKKQTIFNKGNLSKISSEC